MKNTNKKAEVNWIVVMLVIALAVLFAMLFISGNVFTKFMSIFSPISDDLEIKNLCMADESYTDYDNDGYIDNHAQNTYKGKSIISAKAPKDPKVNIQIGPEKKSSK